MDLSDVTNNADKKIITSKVLILKKDLMEVKLLNFSLEFEC